MGFLTILEQIWGLFFQNDVLVHNRSEITKKILLGASLGPGDDLYSFLDYIRQTKILIF